MVTYCQITGQRCLTPLLHLCFLGQPQRKTKVQQRCQILLSHNLAICEPYVFNAYGFHMPQFLPLVSRCLARVQAQLPLSILPWCLEACEFLSTVKTRGAVTLSDTQINELGNKFRTLILGSTLTCEQRVECNGWVSSNPTPPPRSLVPKPLIYCWLH
jgi:hypothetical protein